MYFFQKDNICRTFPIIISHLYIMLFGNIYILMPKEHPLLDKYLPFLYIKLYHMYSGAYEG